MEVFMKVLVLNSLLILALIAAVVHKTQVEAQAEPVKPSEKTLKSSPSLKGKRTMMA
jgi:hypothetical protein